MKHFVGIPLFLLALPMVAAETPMSYVRVIESYSPSRSEPAAFFDMARVTTTYFDGLGRPVETVRVGAGGDFEDVAELTVYGHGDKVAERWLPVGTHSGGAFVAPASLIGEAKAFYGCDSPLTAFKYELSEEGRPVSMMRPGASKPRIMEHGFCFDETVPIFDVDGEGRLVRQGYYKEGTLRFTIETDETSAYSRSVFTDFDGRKVAELEDDAWTFWVYDVCGRLRFTVSPEGARRLTADGVCNSTIVEQYCSEWRYDGRNRVTMSRVPGVAPTYYVYDRLGRLALEQDGCLRSRGQWRFYAYDSDKRLAVAGVTVGISSIPWTREELERKYAQSEISAVFDATVDKDMHMCYRLENAPDRDYNLTNAWYYDSYDFWTSDWTLPSDAEYAFERAPSRLGKPTGCAVMGGMGFPEFTVWLYDRRGRERARCRRQYSAEFIESTFTDCNFIGRPTRCRTVLSLPQGEFQTNPDEVTIDRCFSYMQDGGQLYAEEIRVDGGKWERAYHDYDAAGRLVRRRGGSDGATGYTLDAEGRVTAIANNSYSETLSFAANGLVAEKATSVAYGGEKFVQRMEYDYGDRRFLTAAICGESNLSPFTELFSETFDYDLNGNVTMINRGYPAVQEAAIEYEGNRVSRIVDSSSPAMAVYAPRFAEGEYDRPIAYDQCGRITADRTRRIASILYNDRHLPIRFTMDNGNTLSLSYNADGVKERETETSYYVTTVTRVENGDTVVRKQKRARSTIREYYGDVQRVGGRTRRMKWSGGFFSKDDNGRWHSHRYVRISLGSIVAVTDSAGTVEQAVCYYASGLPVYKTPNSIPATRRMHVGKEFEQFESIDWYDNEARFYDPLLVRFTTPDPLALSYPSLSPYAYCANNPVNNVDLDGQNDFEIFPNGKLQFLNSTADKYDRIYGTNQIDGKGTRSSIVVSKDFLKTQSNLIVQGENVSLFYSNATEATTFFEFVAKNTNVEWSNVLYEQNGIQRGVVGTSYIEDKNITLDYCTKELLDNGQNVYIANHSHPGADATSIISDGDDIVLKKYLQLFPSFSMNIFIKRGDKMDYVPIAIDRVGVLDEITVTAPLKKQ